MVYHNKYILNMRTETKDTFAEIPEVKPKKSPRKHKKEKARNQTV